jgi:hypothetical protein
MHFHHAWAVEEIADWMDAWAVEQSEPLKGRVRWRAALLRALCDPRVTRTGTDHPPTVAFTEWCIAWLEQRGAYARLSRQTMHTINQGFMWFTRPVAVVYKVEHGFVDIYFTHSDELPLTADHLAALVAKRMTPAGFELAHDTKGNTLLRWLGVPVNPHAGPIGTMEPVEAALEACERAARWILEVAPSVTP